MSQTTLPPVPAGFSVVDTPSSDLPPMPEGFSPVPPPPEERGLVGETVAGFKRGGLQLADMAGNIARAVDPAGGVDVVRNAGFGLSKFAKERAAQPDVAESAYVENNPILGNIPKAVERLLPSLTVPLAIGVGAGVAGATRNVAAGAGIVGSALTFGVSQFQDTKERGMENGLSEREATTAGIKTGLSEGGLEAVSNIIPAAKLFKLGKPVAGQVVKSLFKAPTTTAAVKSLANDALQIMTGEVSTEMAQAYTQGLTEKNAGIRPDADPWREAKDVIGPTIALSLMLGGAVGGANKLSKVATQRALQNEGVGEDVRTQAAANVYAGILQAEQDGSAPAGAADNFRLHAQDAIKSKKPLVLTDELLAPPQPKVEVTQEEAAANIVEAMMDGAVGEEAIEAANAKVVAVKNDLDAVRAAQEAITASTTQTPAMSDDQLSQALNLEAPAIDPNMVQPLPEEQPPTLMQRHFPEAFVDPETGEVLDTLADTDPLAIYKGFKTEKDALKRMAKNKQTATHEVVLRESDGMHVIVPKEKPPTETITPESDAVLGRNDAGEVIYQRADGSVYRMRQDRKDRPNGYPDFGGDLSVVDQEATSATDAQTQSQATQEAPSELVYAKSGQPFKSEKAAKSRISTATHDIIQVEGGWAGKPKAVAATVTDDELTAFQAGLKPEYRDAKGKAQLLTEIDSEIRRIESDVDFEGLDTEEGQRLAAQLPDLQKTKSMLEQLLEKAGTTKGVIDERVAQSTAASNQVQGRGVADSVSQRNAVGDIVQNPDTATDNGGKARSVVGVGAPASGKRVGGPLVRDVRNSTVRGAGVPQESGESGVSSGEDMGGAGGVESRVPIGALHATPQSEQGNSGTPGSGVEGVRASGTTLKTPTELDYSIGRLQTITDTKAARPHLLVVARSIGAKTYKAFVEGMKAKLGALWENFKADSVWLWGQVKNEVSDLKEDAKDLVSGKDIEYSMPSGFVSGVKASQIQKTLKLSNVPIDVFQSAEDTPAHIKSDFSKRGLNPEAYYDHTTGRIGVIADNVASVARVQELMRHEWFHAGVADTELTAIYKYAEKNQAAELQRLAEERGFDLTTPEGQRQAAGEYAAQLAETDPKNSLLQKLVVKIREWLRSLGLRVDFKQGEVVDIIQKAIGRTQLPTSEAPSYSVTTKVFDNLSDPKNVTALYDGAFTNAKFVGTKLFRFIFPEDRIIKSALGAFKFKPIHKQLRDLAEYKNLQTGAATDILSDVHTNSEAFRKVFNDDKLAAKAAEFAFKESLYQLDTDMPVAGQLVDDNGNDTFRPPNTKGFAELQTKVEAFAELRALRSTFTPEQLKIIRGMQAHIREADRMRLEALKEQNNFLFGEGSAEAERENEKIDAVKRLAGNYMPLIRFGDYMVRVSDGPDAKRWRTQSFENRNAAADYVKEMRAAGHHAELEVKQQSNYQGATIPATLLDKVKAAAERNGLEGQNLDDFVTEYTRMWAASLPDSSLRVNEVHRSAVAGFDTDLLRVYEAHMQKFANALPRIEYGAKLEQTFRDMRNAIKSEASDSNADPRTLQEMGELYNTLYARSKMGQTEKITYIVKAINKGVFLNYLASPSTYIVQWSQPFMITLPQLMSRHGLKAIQAFSKGAQETIAGKYSDEAIQAFDLKHKRVGKRVLDLMAKMKLEPNAGAAKKIQDQINEIYNELKPEERDLLAQKLMILRGGNDMAFSHDVADDIAGADKFDRGLNKAVEYGGYFMRKSEAGSRRASNIAAFRLEYARTGDVVAASDYAMKVIDDTLYNFGAENRAGWMQGNAGRLLGMFQYFRLHTVAKEFQLLKDSIAKDYDKAIAAAKTDDERAAITEKRDEARKELAYQMGVSFLLAGAAGTPLAMLLSNAGTDLMWSALQAAFGDDDDPWDFKRAAQEAAQDMLGDDLANLGGKGVFSLIGIDVSKRIGMGGMAQLIQGDPPPGITGTRRAEWYAGRLLGPAWGVVSDQIRAIDAYNKDDMGKALQYSSPKIIKDMLKAFELSEKGVEAGGKTILKPEDVTMYDLALKFIGINPMDVSLAQEESRYLKNLSTELSQRRSLLIKKLAEATVEGDVDARQDAIEKLNAWSTKNPKLKVTPQEILTATKRIRDGKAGTLTPKEQLMKDNY